MKHIKIQKIFTVRSVKLWETITNESHMAKSLNVFQ